MEQNKDKLINLEDHKVFVEAVKTDMVPFSVAVKAVEQMANLAADKPMKDLEYAMKELHRTMSELKLDQ